MSSILSDFDPAAYKALDADLWAFIHSELCRLQGTLDLPADRRFLIDRELLEAIFAEHGVDPKRFGLDLDDPFFDDYRLIPALRIAHADIGIYGELGESILSWRNEGLIPLEIPEAFGEDD